MDAVRADDLFALIDREFPDTPNLELSRRLNMDEGRLRHMRKQQIVLLSTADRMLTELGLSHVLSFGGELEVFDWKRRMAKMGTHFDRTEEVLELHRQGRTMGESANILSMNVKTIGRLFWNHHQNRQRDGSIISPQ